MRLWLLLHALLLSLRTIRIAPPARRRPKARVMHPLRVRGRVVALVGVRRGSLQRICTLLGWVLLVLEVLRMRRVRRVRRARLRVSMVRRSWGSRRSSGV